MKKVIYISVASLCVATAHAASTAFTSGELHDGANWSSGLPVSGDVGTIAVDGNLDTASTAFGGTVLHTAGAITATGGSSDARIAGTADWTQSGGQVNGWRQFFVDAGVSYTLTGNGTMTGSGSGGSRVILGGSFSQTGGTFIDGGYDANGGSFSLTGGTATNLGVNITGQALWGRNASSTISIGGDHSIAFSSNVSAEGTVLLDGGATLSFASDWSGSWQAANYSEADWITALDDTGVTFGGTQVTAGNFGTLFNVTGAGTAGSTITAVPEPSSTALLGLAGLALILRRRK